MGSPHPAGCTPPPPRCPTPSRCRRASPPRPPPWEQPSPSVSLPACSAAPPGRILEKTLSPSPPGCPVAVPVGPRGPAALGPALLSAGGQTKPPLAGDGPGQGSLAEPPGCQAAGEGWDGTVPLGPLTCCSQGLCCGHSPWLLWHFRCRFGCVRLLRFRLERGKQLSQGSPSWQSILWGWPRPGSDTEIPKHCSTAPK